MPWLCLVLGEHVRRHVIYHDFVTMGLNHIAFPQLPFCTHIFLEHGFSIQVCVLLVVH